MTNNIIGTQISLLRKKFGLTQEDLANKLGFSKQTVSNWETGLKTPRMGAIQKIADLFNVSKSFIIEGIDESKNSSIEKIYNQLESPRQEKVYVFAKNQLDEQEKEDSRNKNITSLEQYNERKQQKKSMSTIDWCGAASAGTGEFLGDEYREEITLPTEIIPDDADFCLTVNGDSMEPIFHNDDYVFIKKQFEIYSGAIGVVIINGQAYLKRIWFENDIARLQSFNSNYDDIIVTNEDDFRIIGKVVM